MGTQAGRAVPAHGNRGGRNRRTCHAGAAGPRLGLERRSMVGANESARINILRSQGSECRTGMGVPGRRRTARIHYRTRRRGFRRDVRNGPTAAKAGSAGNAGGSHLAWTGGCPVMAADKPFGSPVFSSAGDARVACPVRSLPGLPGTNIFARQGRWGRMTVYAAIESTGPRILRETRVEGRASQKNRRRVERNPV